MAESLYIRFPDDSELVEWVAVDEQGRLAGSVGRGPLEAAAQAAGGRRVVLLLPGLDVVLASVELPAGSATRMRQMVPFALEESLAHDVEKLFFAVGPRSTAGVVPVAVIAHERLSRYLERLRAAGLDAQAAYSDAEGVPESAATLTLIVEQGRIYGRRPEQPPFVLEELALADVLELLQAGKQDATDLNHLIVYADQQAAERCREELAPLRERLASIGLKLLADGATGRFAATLAQRSGTNLLQGPYGQKADWLALLQPWRVAAALMLAIGLLALAGQAVQYVGLQRADQALTAELLERCQQLFSTSAVGSCQNEVMRLLEAAGESPTGLTPASFLAAVSAVAGARPGGTRIEALSYRNRVMDLQLIVPDVPTVDEFARRISDGRRFEARIQSTSSGNDGVESRVQIVSAQP
jgi:general secretion pathway protein L